MHEIKNIFSVKIVSKAFELYEIFEKDVLGQILIVSAQQKLVDTVLRQKLCWNSSSPLRRRYIGIKTSGGPRKALCSADMQALPHTSGFSTLSLAPPLVLSQKVPALLVSRLMPLSVFSSGATWGAPSLSSQTKKPKPQLSVQQKDRYHSYIYRGNSRSGALLQGFWPLVKKRLSSLKLSNTLYPTQNFRGVSKLLRETQHAHCPLLVC